MNRSKDLKGLFKSYMENKNKPNYNKPSVPIVDHRGNYSRTYNKEIPLLVNKASDTSTYESQKELHIYFYEFSDVCRAPRAFYTMEAFVDFMRTCGIYTQLYEREIISHLGTCYVSCYGGTTNLCLRSTYANLLKAMNEHDKMSKSIKNSIKAPTVIHEKENVDSRSENWVG